MAVRTWALAGGAVVVVGAALAGGYYYGQTRQAAPQQQAAQSQAPAPYAEQQQAPPSSSEQPTEQSAQMPRGYESAQYSAEPRFGASRKHRGARHPVDYATFHEELAPYGRWQHSDRWGEVWQPSGIDADFRPYDRGHWVNTREFGWTWSSDYEWGSIPFHYGRWVDDPERGWLWVPGYVWGPGWVVWRSNGRYTGWMPMPPDRGFLRGDETYRNDWHEQADYGYRDWYGPQYDENRAASLWVFVDTGHIADRDYQRYAISRPDEVKRVISTTTNVTNYTTVDNYVVNQSVDVRAVERASGRKVEAVPATTVVKKPEFVIPVSEGKQAQIEARQEVPTGTGKPNTAPQVSQNGTAPMNGNAVPPETGGAAVRPGKQIGSNGGPPQVGGPSTSTGAAGPAGTSPNGAQKPTVFGRMHRFGHRENEGTGPAQASGQANSAAPPNAPKTVESNVPGGAPPSAKQPTETTEGRPANAAGQAMFERRRRGPEGEQVLPPTTPKEGQQAGPAAAPSSSSMAAQQPEAPSQAAREEKRHRALEREQGLTQAAPKSEPRSAETGAPNSEGSTAATGPNAVGSNEGRGPFRHRHEPATAAQPTESAGAQSPSPGGFPRGAENGAASSGENGNSTSEPPRKKKLVVPASVEPGANSKKNNEATPGTDLRTQSPPPDSATDERQSREHKGRHKNDEPGGDNAPPP